MLRILIMLLLLTPVVSNPVFAGVPDDDDDAPSCDLMHPPPGLHWALVTDLAYASAGASADRQVPRISFHPLQWFDDKDGAKQGGDRLSLEASPELKLGDLPSGPVVLFLRPKAWRSSTAADLIADFWSYPGPSVPVGATSWQRGNKPWLTNEALSQANIANAFQTIERVQSQILSEPIRDALLSKAFSRLGYKDFASHVVFADGQFSARERWVKASDIWRSSYVPASINFGDMRRAVIEEQRQSLQAQGLTEADADYQMALYLREDPDRLNLAAEEPNARVALQFLDQALAADPNHRQALHLKLDILLHDASSVQQKAELLRLAELISRIDPTDALARQVPYAVPQDLNTNNLCDHDVKTRCAVAPPPTDLPLTGLQAHYINLANAQLNGANLHNLLVDELDAEHADLRGADLAVDMVPQRKFYGRLRRGLFEMKGDFTDADLRQARIGGADARFLRALEMTIRFKNARLEGAVIANAAFTALETPPSYDVERQRQALGFEAASFNSAELKHVYFERMTIRTVDFTNSRLDHVYFNGITLDHVTFGHAQLNNVGFDGSTFHDVDLSQTDLSGVTLQGVSYDCATRLPLGFSPDRAGMIALSNRCNGKLTPRDYSGLTLRWSGKAMPGSNFDGAWFVGANLPSNLTDVSLKGARSDRYEPGQCDTGIPSLTSELIKMKHLGRARLNGVAIELFDAAAATMSYSGPKLDTAISRLKHADLTGAILKCGPGEDQDLAGWRRMARQATEQQKIFLAGLRTVKGVVIDKSCAGLP